MFAIIKTGGKQYLVEPSSKLKIEKISGVAGDTVSFSEVLLTSDGSSIQLGKPFLSGTSVEGTILSQGRGEKKLIVKFHSKARVHTTKGHRQPFTEVEVKKVG